MTKGLETGARQLREIFAGSLAGFEEGLVLKDAEAGWREWGRPWVKVGTVHTSLCWRLAVI